MGTGERYDVVIVGMGSGGMVAAEFAACIVLKVAVVERHRIGGDCLWTGCVPSKALLASAKVAHHLRHADQWGLPALPALEIDTSLVWKRIREVQQTIATTDDDPKRYESLGVEIVRGDATVVGPNSVDVDGRVLDTRFILLCTGSRPVTPELPGLAEAGFLSSENIFELDRVPASIVALGGGPICIELAQGLNRLGLGVTVLQKGPGILRRDEPELVRLLIERLRDEGVDLRLNVQTRSVEVRDGQKVVIGTEGGEPREWAAEELLVGAGRRPNIEGVGLELTGVEIGPRGIVVDERMRTNVPTIYAAGDVAGRFLFTHSAGHEAVRAVRDMFFPGKGTVSDLVPWCTFTDPELAHAGLTIAEAQQEFGADKVQVWRIGLDHSDRARADGTSEGAIVVVTGPKNRVVGAHILGPGAGELIHELAVAIKERMKLNALAGLIHVYPTLSTSIGQLAAEAAFQGAKKYAWLTRFAR